MPRIPNYTKQQSLNGTTGEAIWTHNEEPIEVILTAHSDEVTTVTVARINDPMDSTDRDILRSEEFNERTHTKSVEVARKWAVDWMKNNRLRLHR